MIVRGVGRQGRRMGGSRGLVYRMVFFSWEGGIEREYLSLLSLLAKTVLLLDSSLQYDMFELMPFSLKLFSLLAVMGGIDVWNLDRILYSRSTDLIGFHLLLPSIRKCSVDLLGPPCGIEYTYVDANSICW